MNDRLLCALVASVTAAFLSACGDSPTFQGPTKNTLAASIHADGPGRNLLYASTLGDQPVYVYTYPRGKMIGIVSGPVGPRGMCVDRAMDIFIPFIYIPGGIYEFAHGGGSPIAYLGFPGGGEDSCSVDPSTGNLAVVGGADFYPAIVVYRHKDKRGWVLQKSYAPASMKSSAFCGYDGKGNLFVDGRDANGAFVLAELPKGGKAFVSIGVSQSIKAPGQVQWDGKHLAIGDTGVSPSVIYQFDVSGSTATTVGSTTLDQSKTVEQFWIQGGNVIAPDSKRICDGSQAGCIAIYRYPSGGSAIQTIALPNAYGATVSLAP